jgi:hypothetical protein
MHLLISAY